MAYVSEFLATLRIGDRGRAYLVTGDGAVIGHPLASGAIGEDRGFIATSSDGKREIARAQDHRDPWLARSYAMSREANPGDSFRLENERFLTAITRLPSETGLDWVVLIVVPEDDILGEIHANEIYAAVAAMVIAFMVLLLGLVHARRRLSGPLAAVAEDLEDMARLETEAAPRVAESRISEVAGMIEAREVMRAGLRSFKRYVPADLVKELMETGEEARLGGEERVLTVMFSDLAGFTAISEQIGNPRDLVHALGDYLHRMSEEIRRRGGTVDKYIGDAIMAFWGAPRPVEDHALRACEAAWASQVMLAERRDFWTAEGLPPFRARIGVHTGEALVGNIGSEARMNYTVMGDSVNLASRLEGICKLYGLEIAVSDETYEIVSSRFAARPVDCVEVKGRSQPTVVHELLGPVGELEGQREAFAALYTDAFRCYRSRDFSTALDRLRGAAALAPDDRSTKILADRCEAYLVEPPPADWNGVVKLTQKG
jgi:adenylate cyclase